MLITGAARRVGRAIAGELAKPGARIALHYGTSRAEAETFAAELRGRGADAAAYGCDLSKESETAGLIDSVRKRQGELTALVNSASVFEPDEAQSLTRASWDQHFETNLRAPFVLSQAFAAQAGSGGDRAIINLIDQRVLKLTPQFFSYTLTKSALLTMTRTMAQAFGPLGIRVNAVGPGPVLRNARQSEADFEAQCLATVLGRGATPDDIASAVRYLLGARAVTGQMIAVDGGQHLIWRTPDVDGVSE